MAGDMLKYLILNACGGIYADMGIDFGKDLLDLVQHYGPAFFLDRNLFFRPAFMAIPSNFYLFKQWIKCLCVPELLSSIGLCNQPALTTGHEIWMHGGVAFTAFAILFAENGKGLISIPPNRGILHHESLRSWYSASPVLGNATLDDAPVTHLDWELHSKLVSQNSMLDATLSKLDISKIHIARLLVDRHFCDSYWSESLSN